MRQKHNSLFVSVTKVHKNPFNVQTNELQCENYKRFFIVVSIQKSFKNPFF